MGLGGKVEAVLTCQGNITDPDFPDRCQNLFDKLSKLLDNKKLDVTKCEPWNSVKVTFDIPAEAAEKLARLAEAGDQVLRDLGILSLQVQGGQVISMTMVDQDSDSDSEPGPSGRDKPQRTTPHKDETVPTAASIKMEPGSEPPSLKVSASSSCSGGSLSPFPGINSSGRPAASAPAVLVKNPLPSSAATAKAVAATESSVLSSAALSGGKEGLLATLMSSRAIAAGKSELFSVKDSDEPATKKARKAVETINKKPSDNNSLSGSSSASNSNNGGSGTSPKGFPFSKLGGSGSGFTILPVSSVAGSSGGAARSFTSGSQQASPSAGTGHDRGSSSSQPTPNPVSSSVKLANLPGVSLTSVSRSNLQAAGHSSRGGGGSLMPPPSSSVTLSPVPRTNSVNNSERTVGPDRSSASESGDSKGSSRSADTTASLSPAASRLTAAADPKTDVKDVLQGGSGESPVGKETSLSKVLNNTVNKVVNSKQQNLLINPVTGQFEMGPSEPAAAAAATSSSPSGGEDKTKSLDPSDLKSSSSSKHKPESSATSSATAAASGETNSSPKLPLIKLKVSLPNSSSKGAKEGGHQSKNNPLKTSASPGEPEPKLPKLKIKLKEQSVELENEAVVTTNPATPSGCHASSSSSSSSSSSDSGDAADNSSSSVQLDLKTRVVRIKTLKMEAGGGTSAATTTINHISVDTEKKKEKKSGSGSKEKKGKDRLAVWTESLAKHTKREDSATKETKSWPELLENRLFTQGSSGTLTNLPNNLSNNLKESPKNQTEKEEKGGNEEADGDHLNWEGPGREREEAVPGPGRTLPPSPPPASLPKDEIMDEVLAPTVKEPAAVVGAKDPADITSVLDILEGRRPLGDPASPVSGGGVAADHTAQQGEDSGIESMDTLSEKSPNQGESPFHGGNDACGMEGSRLPTYSSSMGPVSSGKLSPPVSDSGSTDSLVTATPPDKSPTPPAAAATTGGNPANATNSLAEPAQPSETRPEPGKEPPAAAVTNPAKRPVAINSIAAGGNKSSPSKPTSNITVNCDSSKPTVGEASASPRPPSSTDSTSQPTGRHQPPPSAQSNALTNNSSGGGLLASSTTSSSVAHISHPQQQSNSSTDNNIPDENGGVRPSPPPPSAGDKDLVRSCDGALDKCSGDSLEISCPDKQQQQPSVLTNFNMHDYANVKTVNHVASSASSNNKSSSSSSSTSSDCNIITLKNGEKSPSGTSLAADSPKPAVTDPAVIKAGLRRSGNDLHAAADGPPGLLTLTRAGQIRPPVMVVSSSGPGGGGLAVRAPHAPLRTGRIVPVKLVNVPGAGMRMVQVAGGEIVGSTSSLPPRTVILKSGSPLKSVAGNAPSQEAAATVVGGTTSTTCVVRVPGGAAGSTTSLVRYPAPTPSLHPASSKTCDNSPAAVGKVAAAGDSSQTSVNSRASPSPASSLTPSLVAEAAKTNGTVGGGGPGAKSQNHATESPAPTCDASGKAVPLTNGDIDAVMEPLPAANLTEIRPERRRARNGKKNSGDANNGESEGGGSLLRPLIAKDEIVPSLSAEPPAATNSLPPTDIPGTVVVVPPNPGKRSRRDTGSSVQSDKSDLSVLSSQSSAEPAAKRVKEEEKGRRGSTSPGLRENSRSLERKKGDEKTKEKQTEKTETGSTKKKASAVKTGGAEGAKKSGGGGLAAASSSVANGPKNSKAKPESKKTGGRPTNAKETKAKAAAATGAKANAAAGTKAAAATVAKAGAGTKASTVAKAANSTAAAAKADQGRRVSTRGKKPDETVTSDKKKKR